MLMHWTFTLSLLFHFWRALMLFVAAYSTCPLLLWAWLICWCISLISVRITADLHSPVAQAEEIVWNISSALSLISLFLLGPAQSEWSDHLLIHSLAFSLYSLFRLCPLKFSFCLSPFPPFFCTSFPAYWGIGEVGHESLTSSINPAVCRQKH